MKRMLAIALLAGVATPAFAIEQYWDPERKCYVNLEPPSKYSLVEDNWLHTCPDRIVIDTGRRDRHDRDDDHHDDHHGDHGDDHGDDHDGHGDDHDDHDGHGDDGGSHGDRDGRHDRHGRSVIVDDRGGRQTVFRIEDHVRHVGDRDPNVVRVKK